MSLMIAIPPARAIQDLVSNFSSTNHTLVQALASAIITAAATGLHTCTVAKGSATGSDVLGLLKALVDLGYKASLSGTNIVVSW